MMDDPGDIEYRYVVDCDKIVKGFPEIKCYHVSGAEDHGTLEVIPKP